MRRAARLVISLALVIAAAVPAAAGGLASFGRCLEREGAVFYGTSWCPQCDAQRRVLGSAMSYVPYVECSVDGGRRSTAECEDADIHAYPTWEFGDGSREAGRKSLAALASRTGCPLDGDPDDD
jgi:hypothetical protein